MERTTTGMTRNSGFGSAQSVKYNEFTFEKVKIVLILRGRAAVRGRQVDSVQNSYVGNEVSESTTCSVFSFLFGDFRRTDHSCLAA